MADLSIGKLNKLSRTVTCRVNRVSTMLALFKLTIYCFKKLRANYLLLGRGGGGGEYRFELGGNDF